jgi:hypothetical protein
MVSLQKNSLLSFFYRKVILEVSQKDGAEISGCKKILSETLNSANYSKTTSRFLTKGDRWCFKKVLFVSFAIIFHFFSKNPNFFLFLLQSHFGSVTNRRSQDIWLQKIII